ncbi:UDP-2,3-diacylglucosamine diphosphatase [Alcaligenaceae bacterium]|nr:UDP-2,3-diacylglucosamine diphosphatase [Alcaligenaceae bacterium]
MRTKVVLTGQVWVASDIHLGPQAPATVEAFKRFLDQASQQAHALILLGDIFDAWIGDDIALQDPPAWLSDILAQLQHLASKIPLFLGRGNRDFLIGHALARHLGAHLLPDTFILQADCGPLLLSHGDEYCTADKNYQRMRTLVRTPLVQGIFLSLSLHTRRRIANWARSRSKQANRNKSAQIMDVNPEAIQYAWVASNIDTLVHGHTHRPAVHTQLYLGRECTRIVLPDWDYDHGTPVRSGWLSISAAGPELRLDTFV